MIILLILPAIYGWDYFNQGNDWVGTCASGLNQSPINFNSSVVKEIKYFEPDHMELKFLFNSARLHSEVTNSSYVVSGDLGFLTIYRHRRPWLENIKLLKLHFHSPAENQVTGEIFDLEMHIVMQDPQNQFTFVVFGVFFKIGSKQNVLIQKVINEYSKDFDYSLEDAFPSSTIPNFYSFEGSLTTPPCSENVFWLLDESLQEITTQQFEVFNNLWKGNKTFANGLGNNRKIQDSNNRVVNHYHKKEGYSVIYSFLKIIPIGFIIWLGIN